MSGFLVLAIVALVGICVLAAIAIIGLVLKVLFWIVLFPIRLVLKLTFGLLGVALGAVLLPIVLVIAGIAILGAVLTALFAIVAPLLPVLLLALVGWAIYRASSRRTYELRT
jgi:hypothetical protein